MGRPHFWPDIQRRAVSKVFDAKYATLPSRHYEPSPDGRPFLMLKEAEPAVPSATTIVLERAGSRS